MKKLIYILNGPNLNLLGTREPEVYGRESLADIEKLCEERATALSLAVDFRQSNHEGVLVDWIQEAREKALGIIITEVHLSNIHRREEFRRHSYVSLAAKGVICGLGSHGYPLAVEALAQITATAR
jgi:3-dehydroquinate dehydratase-2